MEVLSGRWAAVGTEAKAATSTTKSRARRILTRSGPFVRKQSRGTRRSREVEGDRSEGGTPDWVHDGDGPGAELDQLRSHKGFLHHSQ